MPERYFRQGVGIYGRVSRDKEAFLTTDDRDNLWPRALFYLGELARLQGRSGEALECFADALRQAPYQGKVLTAVGRLLQQVPPVETIAFLSPLYHLPQDARFLTECLLSVPLPAVCLYFDRQAGERLAMFDRFRLASRPLAAAALAADTAAAFAQIGNWLRQHEGLSPNLAAVLPDGKSGNIGRWEAFSR